ncbi:MAG: preprotein translocase subunit SecE [Phycisphaerales bacterium JB043]
MSLVYKSGQGYWTRMMSAIGAGAVVIYGAAWTSNQFQGVTVGNLQTEIVQGIVLGTIVAIGGLFIYYVFGRHRRANEFFIATEGEMRKVNWSTRREIMGSTWVVIGISLIITLVLFLSDIVFSWFFKTIGVLKV